MKKLLFILILFSAFNSKTDAQNSVKKYVLLEHFTNTNCGICASRNPAFFNLIENYQDGIHHITYHPPYPYRQCIFYAHNKEGNQMRADYYNVQGTPTMIMLGNQWTGGGLMTQAGLEAELGNESPLEVIVTETGTSPRSVDIEVKTWNTVSQGTYKLHLMVAEKTINYNAPNGETVHHNVFRQSIPQDGGISFTPAAVGESLSFNYSFDIDSEWNQQNIYVLAIIQNEDDKSIVNSGTKFDERTTTSLLNQSKVKTLSLSPNPVSDQLKVEFGEMLTKDAVLTIYNIQGKLLLSEIVSPYNREVFINTSKLPKGLMLVELKNEEELWSGKLIK